MTYEINWPCGNEVKTESAVTAGELVAHLNTAGVACDVWARDENGELWLLGHSKPGSSKEIDFSRAPSAA